jgi:hypothetical protein
LKSFADEAVRCFSFLETDFGLTGPDRETEVMPAIAFVSPGRRYSILLDPDDQAVITEVQINLETGRLVAELDQLVVASGLGSRNQVPRSARTLRELKRSLESQADLLRKLHPLIASPDAQTFMRKAHAREWH